MLSNVFAKTLRDRSRGIISVAGGLAAYAIFGMIVYSGFGDSAENLLADMPDAVASIYGGGAGAPGGIMIGAIYHLLGPLAIVGFAISFGSGAIAGEERDRTLGMLLANPISRTRVLLAKAGALLIGVVTIALLLWGAVQATGTIIDTDLTGARLGATTVHLILLGLAFGAVALALSAATGEVGSSMGIAAGIAAVMYLANSMLPLVSGIESGARASLFYYYDGTEPVVNGVEPLHLAVLALTTVVAVFVAVPAVKRRDLKG